MRRNISRTGQFQAVEAGTAHQRYRSNNEQGNEPCDNTDAAKGDKLTWKSSSKAVASVSADGVVTAKKKGKAVITVTANSGKTAEVTITVK